MTVSPISDQEPERLWAVARTIMADDGRIFAIICDTYMIEADGPGPYLQKTEKKVFEL